MYMKLSFIIIIIISAYCRQNTANMTQLGTLYIVLESNTLSAIKYEN